MKYYIIAGEPSGDVHGANLMAAISIIDKSSTFRFWGGDRMLDQSRNIAKHIRETSFMGFVEVVSNLGKIKQLFSFAKKDITASRPDAVILIDYPGFNLRMAKWLKRHHFKVIYYITPQVWAWKENRAYSLKKYCDEIITVLPFEKQFFKNKGIDVHYVGHPLIDEIDKYDLRNTKDSDKLTIALLPGSRLQEIKAMLVAMLQGAKQLDPDRIIIAKVGHINIKIYNDLIAASQVPAGKIKVMDSNAYEVFSLSDLAVVSSGTATLEAGLIGIPQVVCYKVNTISYHIARKLVGLKYISLVNLIMDKAVVPELIQKDCNASSITTSLKEIESNRDSIMKDYGNLREKIGTGGASKRAAEIIVSSSSTSSCHY